MTAEESRIDLIQHLPPGGDSDDFVATEIADRLRSARPDVATPLLEILSEVSDNALTHGASPVGATIRFRLFRRSVELTVTDSGIGIRAHLARGGRPTTSHLDAIRTAIRPGTTGAEPPRGYGLSDSIETLSEIPDASLHIASGDGLGRFSSDGNEVFEKARTTIIGTVVTLKVA